jgi:hypothetical protein
VSEENKYVICPLAEREAKIESILGNCTKCDARIWISNEVLEQIGCSDTAETVCSNCAGGLKEKKGKVYDYSASNKEIVINLLSSITKYSGAEKIDAERLLGDCCTAIGSLINQCPVDDILATLFTRSVATIISRISEEKWDIIVKGCHDPCGKEGCECHVSAGNVADALNSAYRRVRKQKKEEEGEDGGK